MTHWIPGLMVHSHRLFSQLFSNYFRNYLGSRIGCVPIFCDFSTNAYVDLDYFFNFFLNYCHCD